MQAGKLRFELPLRSQSLADVFEQMEAHKERLGILDYSASQPSLESIFLSIAEKDINRHPAARPVSPAPGTAASCQPEAVAAF